MPKVQVNDIYIYYEEYGKGFPLLMILGLQANIDWWGKSLLKKIANNYRVIVFDNRGTGRSDNSDYDYIVNTLVDDTIGLMDILNIDKANIFGHSMGGMISQQLTLNYAERVNKLVLCSSHCGQSKLIPSSSKVKQILDQPQEKLSPEDIARNMLSIFYTEDFMKKNPKFVELAIQNMRKIQTSIKIYNRQIKAIETFDVCEKLKNVKVPTLIMHGIKDILVPAQNGKILMELIPGAKLILFKNSAHVPYVEERNKFIESLVEFLK